jgi:hypothetical protein
MARGSSSSRGKSPGPAAGRGVAVVGGAAAVVPAAVVPAAAPAMSKFSIKIAAILFWMLMALAVTVDKGDKWLYFVTSGVVFVCLCCLYDLDEKDPNYNHYVLVLICIAACAFYAFDIIPYFANYKEFGKKLASTHPVLEDMYEYVKKYLDEINKEEPEAGIQTLENDTYMQFFLAQYKDFEVAQNKWFGLF